MTLLPTAQATGMAFAAPYKRSRRLIPSFRRCFQGINDLFRCLRILSRQRPVDDKVGHDEQNFDFVVAPGAVLLDHLLGARHLFARRHPLRAVGQGLTRMLNIFPDLKLRARWPRSPTPGGAAPARWSGWLNDRQAVIEIGGWRVLDWPDVECFSAWPRAQ